MDTSDTLITTHRKLALLVVFYFKGKNWLRPTPQQTATLVEVEISEVNKNKEEKNELTKLRVTISFQSGKFISFCSAVNTWLS